MISPNWLELEYHYHYELIGIECKKKIMKDDFRKLIPSAKKGKKICQIS